MPQNATTSFADYQAAILHAAQHATAGNCLVFAANALSRLAELTSKSDEETLCAEEIEIHRQLRDIAATREYDIEKLGTLLDRATERSAEDDDHAIEIDPNIIQFWSALDAYRAYQTDQDADQISEISESIMNVLDYHFSENTPLDKWLDIPEIRQEFELQMKDLGASI